MENIFDNPIKYIRKIRNIQLIDINKERIFLGNSIAVIFLTKYCNINCEFCTYKSPIKEKNKSEKEDELDETGIKNSIEIINKSNIGYLLISGGGEPFLKKENLFNLIKGVNVKNIVIVTNGFWGVKIEEAKKILKELQEIQKLYKKEITLRVSIDRWHFEKLGSQHIKNIIDIYRKEYNKHNDLKLRIHTIINDKTIFNILKKYKYNYIVNKKQKHSTDNKILNKSNRYRTFIKFRDGYQLEVEFAKLFKPNLEVDLNKNIRKQIKIFRKDLNKSQNGSFSTVKNIDKSKGLDFLINYNGNISTWGNYQTYDCPNIYLDSYEEIMYKIYNDIISYSFLKEPLDYIIKVVKKVNPTAVKRAIGINIRDYFGMYLLYEKKTLLYYYIILLKKYIREEIIENFIELPNEIKNILKLSNKEIIKLYNKSEYSIINQYMEKEFLENEWKNLFLLISKKHFTLNNEQIKKGIEYYNLNSNTDYTNIKDIINYNKDRHKEIIKLFNV